ncbi:MAG TPA: hypothetical protein VEL47_01585 [Myxococcota bacterium]|nr:hypothetical protein [Myxococcota bacterium]
MAFLKNSLARWLFALFVGINFSVPIWAHRVIIGGGHIGLMDALLADQAGEDRIDIYTKKTVKESTAANIWNSHTHNEIVSVIPPSNRINELLGIDFDKQGISAYDLPGTQKSVSAKKFIDAVKRFGRDLKTQKLNDKALEDMGVKAMSKWKSFNKEAKGPLANLFERSSFNPCGDSEEAAHGEMRKGYRIDLMYGFPDVKATAKKLLEELGEEGAKYKYMRELSPDEVASRDPSLKNFVLANSIDKGGSREWKEGVTAIWRPGGSLDTETFLPGVPSVLQERMGDRFSMRENHEVTGLSFEQDKRSGEYLITGMEFKDRPGISFRYPEAIRFDIVPGEAVGTLERLGLFESPYAAFAGCSLKLEVDISNNPALLEEYKNFRHHMEVHKPGIVLAWQARLRDGKLFVGGAGTKAFYGDVEPKPIEGDGPHEKFPEVNNLRQLQMFRDVLPHVVALGMGVDIKELPAEMTQQHLNDLVKKGVATRWVGRRSVRYNGMPSVGFVYHNGKKVRNGTTITHGGSGGGSFSLILAMLNNYAFDPEKYLPDLLAVGLTKGQADDILSLTDSRLEP